jgi:nicotinic acid mononucleotide adenylyltransferase
MKKVMIEPGGFDPFHVCHMTQTLYFANENDIDEVIVLLSNKNGKSSRQRGEIIEAWFDELPLQKEILRPWIDRDSFPEVMERYHYLLEKPLFDIKIDYGEGKDKNTGNRILKIVGSKNFLSPKDYYLLLGFDAFLKFDDFCNYEEILGKTKLLVNNYDEEKYDYFHGTSHRMDGEYGWKTFPFRIEGESGTIVLPKEPKKIEFGRNPARGLHSTYIRENPGKYLNIFPPKVRKLIENYYIK